VDSVGIDIVAWKALCISVLVAYRVVILEMISFALLLEVELLDLLVLVGADLSALLLREYDLLWIVAVLALAVGRAFLLVILVL